MDAVTLKETLQGGGHVFGCMISAMATNRFGRALASSSLDFCVIDSEHGSRDRAEIQQLVGMLRQAEITPIVRVPVPKSEYVAMALDAGAAGVLAPYCETVEEVQAVVATAKWHPLKGEYLRRAVAEGVFPSQESKAYLENRHRESIAIIGIESVPGHANLEAILDVEGVDGIFIGPNDMSTSLGIPDDYANPKYLAVLEDIIAKAEARGVPVMIHQQTIETSSKAIELGARFVMHSTDMGLLRDAALRDMNALREVAGSVAAATQDKVETV